MRSVSGAGLGLSVVFGCLLLALFIELYYLICWKKIAKKGFGKSYFFYILCMKKPPIVGLAAQEQCSSVRASESWVDDGSQDIAANDPSRSGIGMDLLLDAELGSLCGQANPSRFLFTIVEEAEDLESEDSKSRRESRSLSDMLIRVETPYLTPLESPAFFTPPHSLQERYSQQCLGYSREVSKDAEFNRIRSSPPPRFKFLQDAEAKLLKRLSEEAAKRICNLSRDECTEKNIP